MYLSYSARDIGFVSENTLASQSSVDITLADTLVFTQSVHPAYICVNNVGGSGNVTLRWNDGSTVVIPAGVNDYARTDNHSACTITNDGGSDITYTVIDRDHAAKYLEQYRQQSSKQIAALLRNLWQFNSSTFFDGGSAVSPVATLGAGTTIVPTGGKFTGYLDVTTTSQSGMIVTFSEPYDMRNSYWTIDFWINDPDANAALKTVMSFGGADSFINIIQLSTSGGNFGGNIFGSALLGSPLQSSSGWVHCALVKIGGAFDFYFNGVLYRSANIPTANLPILEKIVAIMFGDLTGCRLAKYSEFRHIAYPAWLAPFTPPTQPY